MMNLRYGPGYALLQPTAPPMDPLPVQGGTNTPICVICSYPASTLRTFPCSCVYPIHDQCISSFRRIGGVCPKCHQVWVPIEMDGQTEVTNALTSTQSQREWLLSQHPHSRSQTVYGCTSCRRNIYFSICCVLLIAGIVFFAFLLVKVYG
jgi:hypothetical protein